MLNGGRPPLMVFLLLQWPTRKLRLLWSLCKYQQICILIYLFFIICYPTDSYTVSTWIVRNKLEPWTLQHHLSTSDDLVNIYNKCLEICPLSICPCFASDIWNKSYMNCWNEMKMKKWSSQWMQFMQLRKRSLKKIQDFNGFNHVKVLNFFQALLRNCILRSLRRSFLHFHVLVLMGKIFDQQCFERIGDRSGMIWILIFMIPVVFASMIHNSRKNYLPDSWFTKTFDHLLTWWF